jgi:hypothetical protein
MMFFIFSNQMIVDILKRDFLLSFPTMRCSHIILFELDNLGEQFLELGFQLIGFGVQHLVFLASEGCEGESFLVGVRE